MKLYAHYADDETYWCLDNQIYRGKSIDVINVRKIFKKKGQKRGFYHRNKKSVCKRDKKNVTLFLLAVDVRPID